MAASNAERQAAHKARQKTALRRYQDLLSEKVQACEASGRPVTYDANLDAMRPVTQADWDKAMAFIGCFGKMSLALREFHVVLEDARLGSYPGATPRPIAQKPEA